MSVQRVLPGPGQESVWDYPRPPRVENTTKHLQIYFNQVLIADTRRAVRVLETSHPPVYYFPPEDIAFEYLAPSPQATYCEWKGRAIYFSVQVNERRAEQAAWSYPIPNSGYQAIRDRIAFYPQKMDACLVSGELVQPQPGGFYGGWITNDIVGPFKGAPGSLSW